jgi:L-arabinose isomerase
MSTIHELMQGETQAKLAELSRKVTQSFAFGKFTAREKELSLRAALAIQKVIADERLNCAAFNSHGPDGLKSQKLGVMCGLGVTLATSAGYPVSEVGDLCTAFAMWLGRRLGGGADPLAEDFEGDGIDHVARHRRHLLDQ